jgi:hypothetical protein
MQAAYREGLPVPFFPPMRIGEHNMREQIIYPEQFEIAVPKRVYV